MMIRIIKYSKSAYFLVIFSYVLLLTASIKDVHQVEICSISHIEAFAEGGHPGNYLYNDENRCILHQSYASINQVEFFSSAFGTAPDLSINLYQGSDDIRFHSTTISGNSFRAPPAAA